jgi:hypothetical protein
MSVNEKSSATDSVTDVTDVTDVGKREDPTGEREEEKKKRQGKVFLASPDIH